jgi:hypothetical protein
MLPYIEQNPFYQLFQNNTLKNNTSGDIALLSCPSRNPTGSPFPLSYVVNSGMIDNQPNNAPGVILDYQANGIFFDWFTPVAYPLSPGNSIIKQQTELSYLSKHDGASNTLMLSENVDALDWYSTNNLKQSVPPLPAPQQQCLPPQVTDVWSGGAVAGDSWWNGFTWTVPSNPLPTVTIGGATVTFGTSLLNKNAGYTPATDMVNGRPASMHPGGFVVTMCDASTRFMGEDIEYRVYCLLMAPDNGNATGTKYMNASLVNYPKEWRTPQIPTGTLTPLTAADLEK